MLWKALLPVSRGLSCNSLLVYEYIWNRHSSLAQGMLIRLCSMIACKVTCGLSLAACMQDKCNCTEDAWSCRRTCGLCQPHRRRTDPS